MLVFVCLAICFLYMFDSFGWLLFITFCFTIIAGMVRQYKSMQNISHGWESIKTVSCVKQYIEIGWNCFLLKLLKKRKQSKNV